MRSESRHNSGDLRSHDLHWRKEHRKGLSNCGISKTRRRIRLNPRSMRLLKNSGRLLQKDVAPAPTVDTELPQSEHMALFDELGGGLAEGSVDVLHVRAECKIFDLKIK
eukprot:Platyproteum_vivax@DN6929_c0_g3_i4.p1